MPHPAAGGQGVPGRPAPSRRGRTAVRVAAPALGLGLAAAMLAGCSVSVGALQHRTSSYPVSGPVRTLVVHGHVGNIDVTGGSSSTISVTEQLTFRQTAPVTTHRLAAGTLTLASSCPALESCGVGYDITVPRAVALQIADGVGTVRLHGLAGRITVQAGTGSIELGSVSGPVEASTGAGQILGQDISSAQATLRLSAGRIDVTFAAAPSALSATATAGSVTLRVPGGVPYLVHTGTAVGSTQVSVTRSAGSPHVIIANTTTGSIIIEPAP
jgi:hypothetical protein